MSEEIERLFATILDARELDPSTSKTAKLFSEGIPKMAKKVAEEGAEVAIEAVRGERQGVISESADLLYNLAVLWAEMGVTPGDVLQEIAWRERTFGIAEKLPKDLVRRDAE